VNDTDATVVGVEPGQPQAQQQGAGDGPQQLFRTGQAFESLTVTTEQQRQRVFHGQAERDDHPAGDGIDRQYLVRPR